MISKPSEQRPGPRCNEARALPSISVPSSQPLRQPCSRSPLLTAWRGSRELWSCVRCIRESMVPIRPPFRLRLRDAGKSDDRQRAQRQSCNDRFRHFGISRVIAFTAATYETSGLTASVAAREFTHERSNAGRRGRGTLGKPLMQRGHNAAQRSMAKQRCRGIQLGSGAKLQATHRANGDRALADDIAARTSLFSGGCRCSGARTAIRDCRLHRSHGIRDGNGR